MADGLTHGAPAPAIAADEATALTSVKCPDYGANEAPFALRLRVRCLLRESGRPALAQAFWGASESCADRLATLREVARRFVLLQTSAEEVALDAQTTAWLRQCREELPAGEPLILQIVEGRLGLRLKSERFLQREPEAPRLDLGARDEAALRAEVLEPAAALLGLSAAGDVQLFHAADGTLEMVLTQLLPGQGDHA